MSVIEGTTKLKTWRGFWDFAIDGGAVSSIPLRSNDGPLPINSVVEGGYVDVVTLLTSSASGAGALQVEGAADTVASAAVSGAPWSTTGRKSVIPAFTGATTLKTTAARKPTFVIATGALTAGKFELVLFYK